MGFDICIVPDLHHNSIIENGFIIQKCLCCFPLPLPEPLAITDIFTVSVVLPFPGGHVVRAGGIFTLVSLT